ncbi:MAG: hypothetical protein DI538_30795 [Azospira oryzae]|nr:MAG: hypothetical protein DI538_30795 [Azospira oryzae]
MDAPGRPLRRRRGHRPDRAGADAILRVQALQLVQVGPGFLRALLAQQGEGQGLEGEKIEAGRRRQGLGEAGRGRRIQGKAGGLGAGRQAGPHPLFRRLEVLAVEVELVQGQVHGEVEGGLVMGPEDEELGPPFVVAGGGFLQQGRGGGGEVAAVAGDAFTAGRVAVFQI